MSKNLIIKKIQNEYTRIIRRSIYVYSLFRSGCTLLLSILAFPVGVCYRYCWNGVISNRKRYTRRLKRGSGWKHLSFHERWYHVLLMKLSIEETITNPSQNSDLRYFEKLLKRIYPDDRYFDIDFPMISYVPWLRKEARKLIYKDL